MKTIKERAKSYARKVWCGGVRDFVNHKKATELDFIAGAQSEREELTRWNDPNKPPTDKMRVIAKCVLPNGATFVTGAWYAVNEFPTGWSVDLDRTFENLHVLCWRPIYENE